MTTPRTDRGSRARRFTLALAVSLLPWLQIDAAAPVFWRVSTQDEFLRGEAENVSIDADGQVALGPEVDEVYDPEVPFLWDASGDAEALWIASGSDGKVFRLAPDGTAVQVFDAEAQNVHTIHVEAEDTAVVGTSPDGAVFRIGAETQESVFDPDDKYIWSLASAPDGTVYVATGDAGKIYRIAPDGTAALHYEADATHVLALTFDQAGHLVAGTGTPGRVVRIDASGRAFVLLDSPFAEIRALHRAADGTLYAVGVGRSPARAQSTPPATPQRSAGVPSVTTSTTVTAVVVADASPQSATPPPASEARSGDTPRGAVYRIRPDGVWDTVWESSQDAPYDVTLDATGGLLIATGSSGKLYKVLDDPPKVVLVGRAAAQQVTRFASGPGASRYYVTSNPGRVYRQTGTLASRGQYLSEVRDAQTVATWGTLRWQARIPDTTALRLYTRTGNTAAPNDTWSAWSSPYTDPTGSAITSPKARYIQWKAEFEGGGDTPTLLSVTTAYLPQNLRPEISSLTVHDPGVAFQKPFSSGDPPLAGLDELVDARTRGDETAGNGDGQATLGRRIYRKGLQTFVWNAKDPNDDPLSFDVLYRSESELTWHPLRTGLTDGIFTWDTTSVPDGTYLVRVTASDARGNAPGAALVGAAESAPFDIDNSAPRFEIESTIAEGDRVVVRFVVRDMHSAVHQVEYSTDTETWNVLYPADGIADSRAERFELSLEGPEAARLVIRAVDAMNNAVTTSVPR